MTDTKPDLDAIEADLNDPWLPDRATVDELVAYARTLEADNERLRDPERGPLKTARLMTSWTQKAEARVAELEAALAFKRGLIEDISANCDAAEAERDRLAQRLDQVRALADEWERWGPHTPSLAIAAHRLRRVLDGDQRTDTHAAEQQVADLAGLTVEQVREVGGIPNEETP